MGSETQKMLVIEEQVVNGSCPKTYGILKRVSIKTDTSQVGLGAVLTQEYEIEGKKVSIPFSMQVDL